MAELKESKHDQLGYEQTLMYGKYTKNLAEFAKAEAERLQKEKETILSQEKKNETYKDTKCGQCVVNFVKIRNIIFDKVGEDWIFLLILGISMALLSFALDYSIAKFQTAHIWLYEKFHHPFLKYISWVGFPIIFIAFSAGFVHLVEPNAIGSGIPEMKTILRGVVLKEYLTFKTLVSKVIGLATALGSGLPLGKEGPFVHIASIVATLLSKILTTFKGLYKNESRNVEMLAAACAVGVSCTFSAPIGGVLFSIEVTATYFAVRDYWRGFFAATSSAFVFRLLAVWIHNEDTITALFKTTFDIDFPFDVEECIAFSIIGIVCGFGGALFVYLHRRFVYFSRKHKKISQFLQRNRFIYPVVIALIFSTITFPLGLGKYMASQLTQKEALNELFSSKSWISGNKDIFDQQQIMHHWQESPNSNIFITLVVFIIMKFWMTAIAVTLPVPAGIFMPVFIIGAAFGRLVGESMAVWFPNGIRSDGSLHPIFPGVYAVVGAAALSGSVTHTISTSVIVFELTGQIVHILPVMIAVLLSNAIAHLLQPSVYDSIIQIKKLPYLPDIGYGSSRTYNIYAETIMVRDIKFITFLSTYLELKELLATSLHNSYPLVDSKDSMILLGSIQRLELQSLLDRFIESLLLDNTTENFDESGSPTTSYQTNQIPVINFKKQEENLDKPKSILKKVEGPFISEASVTSLLGINNFKKTEDLHAFSKQVDFKSCQIDPSPFQLVERTSLHKIHSLFSLLGLSHAYVTNMGHLVGIVALKEVRHAIEGSCIYSSSDPENSSTDS